MWPISLIKFHKKTQNCNKFDKKQRKKRNKNAISSKKTAKKEEMENVWQKIL